MVNQEQAPAAEEGHCASCAKDKEIEELKNHNTRLSLLYVISNLWVHILYSKFSHETLELAWHFEYQATIARREKLSFNNRIKYDRDDNNPKLHLPEMVIISAILDDIELYTKLLDYMYAQDIDHYNNQLNCGISRETVGEITPRSRFNSWLYSSAMRYLTFNHVHFKLIINSGSIDNIKNTLSAFNLMVESTLV